jgi:hypothetical protein
MKRMLLAARAEALFLSHMPTGEHVTRAAADATIRLMLRTHGGVRGCAGDVAHEFGDHPEQAVPRMRWALAEVVAVYPNQPCSRLTLNRHSLAGV